MVTIATVSLDTLPLLLKVVMINPVVLLIKLIIIIMSPSLIPDRMSPSLVPGIECHQQSVFL